MVGARRPGRGGRGENIPSVRVWKKPSREELRSYVGRSQWSKDGPSRRDRSCALLERAKYGSIQRRKVPEGDAVSSTT